ELVRFDDESAIRLWHFNFVAGPRSGIQAPLSRKRMSTSRTVSSLTGKIQSAGVERQPGVEHLRCKARSPLVPPTTSIWRPEISCLQIVQYSRSSRQFHCRLLSIRRKAASLSSAASRIGCEGEDTFRTVAN